jgi:hypothetical protein
LSFKKRVLETRLLLSFWILKKKEVKKMGHDRGIRFLRSAAIIMLAGLVFLFVVSFIPLESKNATGNIVSINPEKVQPNTADPNTGNTPNSTLEAQTSTIVLPQPESHQLKIRKARRTSSQQSASSTESSSESLTATIGYPLIKEPYFPSTSPSLAAIETSQDNNSNGPMEAIVLLNGQQFNGSEIILRKNETAVLTATVLKKETANASFNWKIDGVNCNTNETLILDSDSLVLGNHLIFLKINAYHNEITKNISIIYTECIPKSDVRPCEKQQGVCTGSTKTCSKDGFWLGCSAPDYGPLYEPLESTCDGLDNDCDGFADKNHVCNSAPVFSTMKNRSVFKERFLTFTVFSYDPDGDNLNYGAIGLPDGAILNATNKSAMFSWTPSAADIGMYEIVFNVSDGAANSIAAVNITVMESDCSVSQDGLCELSCSALYDFDCCANSGNSWSYNTCSSGKFINMEDLVRVSPNENISVFLYTSHELNQTEESLLANNGIRLASSYVNPTGNDAYGVYLAFSSVRDIWQVANIPFAMLVYPAEYVIFSED